MTSDIICIHQGEDGTACAFSEAKHCAKPRGHLCTRDTVHHPFVPGRKCPTCDGRGFVMRVRPGAEHHNGCLTCADSPVRGYVPV